MFYNICLIIPKDLQNKQLDQSFVCSNSAKYKECKFICDYNSAIKLNKINGRYKFIHSNGGLEKFNIILLESINCDKDELSMYKMHHQLTVDNTIDVIKKIAIQS